MKSSDKLPDSMKEKFNAILSLTNAFSDSNLDSEYKEVIRLALAKLSRKRPSPLLRGKENVWAAGVVHAVGMTNFLFDSSQAIHCKSQDIYTYFGVAPSTGQNKSKEIREMLGMHQFAPEWMLPSKIDGNPLIWMVSVNGMIVDIRKMPREVQEIAFEKGLIPHIPELKKA